MTTRLRGLVSFVGTNFRNVENPPNETDSVRTPFAIRREQPFANVSVVFDQFYFHFSLWICGSVSYREKRLQETRKGLP